MKRKVWSTLGGAACAFLLAVPIAAASKPATQAHKTTTKTMAKQAMRRAWRAETLSAKIITVDPAGRLVVVKSPDGVSFDMIVTPSTRIKSGDMTLKLSDLASDTNKSASIHFVPERRGDVAQSIQVTG